MRDKFRGVLEWTNEGIPLGTQSNEAAKLYDATITQYVGLYDDANFNGIGGSLNKMLEADPDFIAGKALKYGLELMSTAETTRINKDLAKNVDDLVAQVSSKSDANYREKMHVQAVLNWSRGNLNQAAQAWEDVLVQYPTDMLAIKMVTDTYFFLGKQRKLRDSVARVMPLWSSADLPLKSYLHGMYAFGLVETNFYAKAESEARKGLECEPKDGWSTHALAHVFEMEGRVDEGISHLSTTLSDWEICNLLATHNYWHWALYHIEKGEPEAAVEIFETEIRKRCHESGAMLDIVDCFSLPFRLQLENPESAEKLIGKHWSNIVELCEPHLNDHILSFNDAHFMMALCGARKYAEADELLENSSSAEWISGSEVNRQLLKSILAYSREQYELCVDLLYPIRYDLVVIGGSDAQRDVFNQLLIAAALNSTKAEHRRLVKQLILERAALKPVSPLTDRLSLKLN
ncbi:tetratricopeptide repeat protein 38-like isoform X2 [Bradysia coprophila]|nr:tetratricopeptide repeat protein 38-like isoform X2 [Bradysia coprophila]XP_037033077.1 tetratricopeptide repeat protein 38-like isoform X2 [Bradysia coprophila]XP_037033078.1 tetratricopeptide repeat protein 38-like isoform X2 [Bradysia coprophila]